ncbi:MAG TPA: diaminopimelate epimerase [Steroidobacteraceae bacterium]|nr:diaminopimelate epimerase [Steroidobacteraceae bacterium]
MRFDFTKMHGAGNDFIVLDAPARDGLALSPAQWRQLSDRRTGIGFDQALVLEPPRSGDTAAFYRIFNADGSEVEQCGNGVRCLADLLRRRGVSRDGVVRLGSPAGLIEARLGEVGRAAVDMGEPAFTPASVDFDTAGQPGPRYFIDLPGGRAEFAIASMGNPHAVLDVPDVATAPVGEVGPVLERHPRFRQRVNVGFRQIIDRGRMKLRVFERGVGETLACGTGACAAVATGILAGLLDAEVKVQLPGGLLVARWNGPGTHLWLEGPAAVSFTGQFEL